MGLFDTVYFDKTFPCSQCAAEIASTQTHAFEETLSDYHVKDCISHAEDIRIEKEELYCDTCSKLTGQHVYITVVRGIFVGVADTLQSAQNMLSDMNQEKMILWYHDLFKKYRMELREKSKALGFMRNTVKWFENEYHKLGVGNDKEQRGLLFNLGSEYLKDAQEPLAAIKNYLAANDKKDEDQNIFF